MVACAEILTAERKCKKLCARCELYLENCGYRYDAETENYYVRNRCYSPTLGRWLTRDPTGYRGGINLNGYVNSSPVGNVDAEGLAGPTRPTGPGGHGECIFFCRVKFLLCAYLLTEETEGVGFIYCVILFSQCERRCPPARRHPGACSHLHGLGRLYGSPYTYYP